MADALIQLRGVAKLYTTLPALRQLDLDIQRGEWMALLGHNGSGKSTLIRLLCALSKPTSGTIRIGGWELPREAAAVRAQIGMVGHRPLIYDNLTARENLRFFARLYNLPDPIAAERAAALLTRVGLSKRADDLVRGFSRGMQQRLSIARALLHDPAILLLDEPHTGLDQDAAAMLDDVLRQAHADGKTILMATHELDRAARLASRATLLVRGALAHDAPLLAVDPARTGAGLAALYAQANTAGAR